MQQNRRTEDNNNNNANGDNAVAGDDYYHADDDGAANDAAAGNDDYNYNANYDDDDVNEACSQYLVSFLEGTTDARDTCEGIMNAYTAAGEFPSHPVACIIVQLLITGCFLPIFYHPCS